MNKMDFIKKYKMKECGFIPYKHEWWHFDDKDEYEIIPEMYE